MSKAVLSRSIFASMLCSAVALGSYGAAAQQAESPQLEVGDRAIEQTAQGIVVPERRTEVRRGETVRSRPRPELDPLGGRIGSFLVFPTFGLQEDYQTNIFATPDNEVDDFITHVEPGLFVQSDWSRHFLRFGGSSDLAFHADNSNENYTDYFLSAEGRADIATGSDLNAFFDFDHRHVPRSSPNNLGAAAEPIEFDVIGGGLSYTQEFNRFRITPEVSYQDFTYFNTPRIGGGDDLDTSDRDRGILEVSLRGDYAFSPGYSAFVRGSYNDRNYKEDADPGDVNRDSQGYEVVAGVAADLGGLVFGELFVGYLAQDFSDGQLDNISEPTIGADITWNVTPLTTVEGTVERTVEETIVTEGANTASSNLVTSIGLSVDHELLRNLILGANVGFELDDFEGISREDKIFDAGVNADYIINRYLVTSAGYEFFHRNSNDAAAEYTDHLFFIRLQLQY